MGEGDDGTPVSFEGARLPAECLTATTSGEEVEALDLGGGVDVENTGVERCIAPMLPCVAQLVAGSGEVVRMS